MNSAGCLQDRYLKQEITASHNPSGSPGRFTSIAWHPEDPLRLILTTPCECMRKLITVQHLIFLQHKSISARTYGKLAHLAASHHRTLVLLLS